MNDTSSDATGSRWWRIGAGVAIVLIVLVAFGLGRLVRWGCATTEATQPSGAQPAGTRTKWTCSMHPEVRLPKPGLCPKCNMELIPVSDDAAEPAEAAPRYVTSEAAKALMDIETAPVQRRFVSVMRRMVGTIAYDETRLSYITAWVAGRLDRLFVDYTGVPVREGDHMVVLYSPALLTAQAELIQALAALQDLPADAGGIVRESARATVAATRDKLRLLGLKPEQIADIEQRGKPDDHVTIYAPAGGIVVRKHVQQGAYVQTGTRIYTIADLSRVWIMLEAYESDLAWLRYGQTITFTTAAHPGEEFTGMIAFIDPVLDARTRTVEVRVNAANPRGRLKPGMFVTARVEARVAASGRVMDPSLAGKWISPMHPEIIKDAPGTCDVCGMPLVRAESLGFVGVDPSESDKPLVIPASAPLVTGKRAVVYVEVPGAEQPTYEGREIVLGPRAGPHYLVEAGLREGERVVTHGAFKIDSALQIHAAPSMMSGEHPDSTPTRPAATDLGAMPQMSAAVRSRVAAMLRAYYDAQQALAADDNAAAMAAMRSLNLAVEAADEAAWTGHARHLWTRLSPALSEPLERLAAGQGIEATRRQFEQVSEATIGLVKALGVPTGRPAYQMWCPMAFDNRGAHWLQPTDELRNPYFGAAMLECGGMVERFAPTSAPAGDAADE